MTPSLKSKLQHTVLITPSGIRHPYSKVLPSEVMKAAVICYPPLGHDTVISQGQKEVIFTVAVQTDTPFGDWEVHVWHNQSGHGSDWTALPLSLENREEEDVGGAREVLQWFKGSLKDRPSSSRPVSFTVRFRPHPDQDWSWIKDHTGSQDGQILYQSSLHSLQSSDELSTYINHLSPNLTVELVQSDTPNTLLWSITAPAAPAKGEKSGWSDHCLGLPNDYVRWFSLVRLWSPWLAPRQGKGLPLAEKDAVLYSFLRRDGLHVVTLAISGIDNVLTVFKAVDGKIMINSRNDREEQGTARIVVAIGSTFDEANAAVMYRARHTLSPYLKLSAEDEKVIESISTKSKDVKASWVQDWYDGFTYCTWNGLGQNLTEEKIANIIASLEKEGIRITNLIIDDNWQSLDNEGQNQMIRGWTDFEANPKAFPNGLKHAIQNIRQKSPNIQHIAVWHALLGYWGAVSPTGKIAKTYKTIEVQKRGDVAGGKFTVVDAPDVKQMYDDFYTFLSSTGIDSVKTDAQFFIDEIDTAPERRALTSTYLTTWVSAQLRHFSGHAISCMSQTPSIMFPCQLPNSMPALPVRNSDDFFPDIEESHPWHIFCNAHNSLIAQHLNALPDWDMFQTNHKWAWFHASARALSGGPIYITDEPGHHNVELISQITAQTTTGQTVILRPSVVGRSVEKYIGFEEQRITQMQSYNGASQTGSAFLGLWNCLGNELSELVPLSNFMGVQNGSDYILRNHRSGLCALMQPRDDVLPLIPVTVEGHDWALFTLRPVEGPFELSGSHSISVSNLGLVGKMAGSVAILRDNLSVQPSAAAETTTKKRLRITTSLKALGTLGLWVSSLEKIDLKDTMVMMQGKPIPFDCVSKSEMDTKVLEIDVKKAWEEMGLNGGWNNEVEVEAFLE